MIFNNFEKNNLKKKNKKSLFFVQKIVLFNSKKGIYAYDFF